MPSQLEDHREYPTHPLPAVAGVIVDGERVLLVRRRNPPSAGEWSVPGGKQELGEQIEEALRREVREETGLDVATLRLLEAGDIIRRDDEGQIRYHYVLLYFVVRIHPGEPRAGDDVSDVCWAGQEEMTRLGLSVELREIVDRALAQEKRAPLARTG